MDNLAQAIQQLQSGALERSDFFIQLDRALASAPGNAVRMLEALSEQHARSPLAPELYAEVQQHIERSLKARKNAGADDTFVQTRPGAFVPAAPPVTTPPRDELDDQEAEPERMKAVGDTLNGRFVLEECVGFGGMGTVYKALDLRKLEAADRKPYIAIKVLNVQFRGHPKSLIALQREARKAQALAHPNIVSVYDFDRDGQTVYLTMEYLSGKSLSQMLRAPGFTGMPYADALKIVEGMGKALAYAHERGFVHCDFKPGNVILTDSGVVKVIDFGIARVFQKAEEEVDVTVFDPGSLGALTPAYASPEMLEHLEPDPRDDIYALSCITYELLTGSHPFNRLSALQARAAGIKPQQPPGLSRARWRALKDGLSLERATRTPTVNRLLSQLSEPDHGPRNKMLAMVGGGIAALLIAGVAVWRFGLPGKSVAPPPAVATQQAPVPAPVAPPAAAPMPDPAAIAAALAAVPCSALLATATGRTLRVQGYLAKAYGNARLSETLGAVTGVSAVELDVQPVADNNCAVISALGPYWSAHRRAGGGAKIVLSTPGAAAGNVLTDGDSLMVDITTAGADSFATVDYFEADGSVVHLLPNLRARDNRAPPRYTATIGSLGNWMIAKPFGSEIVALVTTPVPLFDALRPETESAADYLRALEDRLKQASASAGGNAIAVDFVQISTRARKR
ncbi:protein kinase [Massilia sp. R2A-15]|uniref:serine/threonine protein kinase n=1 Tax=Massilia sp. R2A-15 TaxID=3064278 RepID=UPI002736AC46|nr:serine/threonine protein kinase [Massilia sp. R2A-15]WLI88817.1 protein kinase [Massilia sp. R2A-15]